MTAPLRRLRHTLLLPLLIMIVAVLAACDSAGNLGATDAPDALIEDVVIASDAFAAQTLEGMSVTGEGLIQESSVSSGIFVSEPLEAPIPFNAVVPQWIADVSEFAELELQLRTSADGRRWEPWQDIHGQTDWMLPDDPDIVGEMLVVPAADKTHRFVQYMITTSGAGITAQSLLRELRLTFINSTDGPTADELITAQESLNLENGTEGLLPDDGSYPKPFVVSRNAWCQHSDCTYSQGLEYEPVTHLIVHHTVSANNSPDWAATVRAIWNFHTYSRGWGDIGYNYLVDPNGVLYEGHFGGDDVVGTHAAGANAGTMALSLLGTFTDPDHGIPGIEPPPAMANSAVDLLSWKADQRDINVFDASDTLPNIDWGLPNMMGHRDVYGTTECPGNQAFRLLPEWRQRVANNIGLVSPYIYVDELSPAFSKSNANWQVPPYMCGFDLNAYYTWSTTEPAASTNWGEWRLDVPADGRYTIDAYVPYCRTGRSETRGAQYIITHAGGTTTKAIDQNENVGLWIPLGEYTLNAGNSNKVRLTDVSSIDSGVGVWFDAIRLRPVTSVPVPAVVNDAPVGSDWLGRDVTFRWSLSNPEGIQQTKLQVATDPAFANMVAEQAWPGAVTEATYSFIADYPLLYWRIVLDWSSGPPVWGAASQIRVDGGAPVSSVESPFFIPFTNSYRLSWTGTDAASGIMIYNVDYRATGENWVRWLSATPLGAASFVAPNAAQVYEFRSQATDVAGNVEALKGTADATTGRVDPARRELLAPGSRR